MNRKPFNDFLVEVFVSTGGGKGEVATGYPVAPGVVVTARHALFPGDKAPRSIEVRWHHQNDEWIPAALLWDGEEQFDVALLSCEFPIEGFRRLSTTRPAGHAEWESQGFARVEKRDDGTRPPVSMSGHVESAATSEPTFDIIVTGQPETEEGWKGASGSPVFVDGEIIGIIATCPRGYSAARLRATPAWKLLQEESFSKALGYDDAERKKQLAKARRAFTDILAANEAILRGLADYLETAPDTGKVADALFGLYPSDALSALYEVRHRLCELAEAERNAGLKPIKDLVHIILPSVFDHSLAALVRSKKKGFRYTVLELPIATKTVAEIIMAAVDMRPARFKPLAPGEHLPEGEYLLPEQPNGGMAELDEQYMNDTRRHLDNKFLTRFNKKMIVEFAGKELPSYLPNEVKVEQAAAWLEHLAKHPRNAHSYYYVYVLPDEPEESEMFRHTIEKLQRDYPALAFINLQHPQQYAAESRPLFLLNELLREAHLPTHDTAPVSEDISR